MNRVLYLLSMRCLLLGSCFKLGPAALRSIAWYSGLSYDYRFIGNKRDLVLKKKNSLTRGNRID